MCECCGMGRSPKRPKEEGEARKNPAVVRVDEVAAEPKGSSTAGAGPDNETRARFVRTAVERFATGPA